MKNGRRHLHELFENELVLVGAPDEAALLDRLTCLTHDLDHTPDATLADIAFACGVAARKAPAILALVASSREDLRAKLRIAQRKLTDGAARIRDKSGIHYTRDRLCPAAKTAFVFPGELSPYPDMLRDLCLAFGECREAFDETDAAARSGGLEPLPSESVFAVSAGHHRNPHPSDAPFAHMAGALTASHTANTALTRVFNRLGIRPDAVAGHSGGEISALEYAGVFGWLSSERRIKFLCEGHRLILRLSAHEDIPESLLIEVSGLERDAIDGLLARHPGRLALAMQNGRRHFVLCAASKDVADALARSIRRLDARLAALPFRRSYHTPWFARGVPALTQFFNTWIRQAPATPVYSCVTAARLPQRLPHIVKTCGIQWASPVRFTDTIEQMYADGIRVFIELGARGQLTSWIDDLLGDRPHLALAANRIHRSGMRQLNHVLAQLAAHGVEMDAAALHARRASNPIATGRPNGLTSPREKALKLPSRLPEIQIFAPHTLSARNPGGSVSNVPERNGDAAENDRRPVVGADFPMLAGAEIVNERPGEFLSLIKSYALEDYPFIEHFALGAARLPTTYSRLHGFSVMSIATCLEIMAEAARKVVPRKRVDQVVNLRAQGWIGFERGEARLAVQAERIEWPDRRLTAVKVQLREGDVRRQFTWPLAETTILLTSSPAETLTTQPAPLQGAREVDWKGTEIYPDRLPQGPLLRSVQRVGRWGRNGIDYELCVPTRADSVRHTRIPLFTCWPLLMDGVGSGMALWRSIKTFNGVISTPFRARNIRFLASAFPDDMRLRATLRIKDKTPKSHVADIQVADEQGRLLMDITGWEELDTEVSSSFHRFILRPADNFATRKLPASLLGHASVPVVGAMVSEFPRGLLEAHHEIWLKTLAFTVLSPSERDDWIGMKGTISRRVEWLLGRVAAKDAVRHYLLQYHHMTCAAAEIPIWADDSGKPHPHGAWRDQVSVNLDLSIAHTPDMVLAAVVANARIGIDLERIGRDLSEDFTQGVFTAAEHELAARSGEGPTAMLRFWCAKEALSKALGSGIRYTPCDLCVQDADTASGRLVMEVSGQWLHAYPRMRQLPVTVQTSLHEKHVFASCVLPLTVSDVVF